MHSNRTLSRELFYTFDSGNDEIGEFWYRSQMSLSYKDNCLYAWHPPLGFITYVRHLDTMKTFKQYSIVEYDGDSSIVLALAFDLRDLDATDFLSIRNVRASAGLNVDSVEVNQSDLSLNWRNRHRQAIE